MLITIGMLAILVGGVGVLLGLLYVEQHHFSASV
jgi:hypothetical protein